MSEFDITEQLIRYLEGDMTQEERVVWMRRLATDDNLRVQLEGLNLAKELVQLAGAATTVHRIHQEFAPVQPSVAGTSGPVHRIGTYIWLRVAAAVTILVILAAGWWVSQTTTEAIYRDHFVEFAVNTSRGNEFLSVREQLFANKQYNDVVKWDKEPMNGRDSLITGIAFLHIRQYDSAIVWLQTVQGTKTYSDDADYYLAFAFAGKGDVEDALQLFTSIQQEPQHLYHHAVTANLIRKLRFRRLW